jgi:hypothetical protein
MPLEMSSDVIEMESWRYSNKAFFVLPLSSGRIAVLQPNRQFYAWADSWEHAKELGPLAARAQEDRHVRTISALAIDIEDLDL